MATPDETGPPIPVGSEALSGGAGVSGLDGALEGAARGELDAEARGDLELLARLRVDTGAGTTLGAGDCEETGDRDGLALGKVLDHDLLEGLEGLVGVRVGEAGLGGDGLDELGAVHAHWMCSLFTRECGPRCGPRCARTRGHGHETPGTTG